jgi:hypothetical protein
MLQISLDPQLIKISVSFPKIGVMLAEFQSVFSIVLVLGFMIKLVSG